jgi:hypothetical protein
MAQQTYPTPAYGPTAPQCGPPAPSYGPPAPTYGPPAPPYGHPAGFGSPPAPAPRSRTGVLVGAVLGGVLVLGGLAVGAVLLFGTKILDSAEAEHLISQATEDQAGVAPTDVSCPSDIEAEAGATFVCSAFLEGQPISFTVTQTDDDGNVEVTSVNTFVDVATVEAALTQQVGDAAGVEVMSTCHVNGHSVLVDGVGAPIPCTVANVEDPSDTVEVTATVDENGTVSYEVA